jgi:hypothetical protein
LFVVVSTRTFLSLRELSFAIRSTIMLGQIALRVAADLISSRKGTYTTSSVKTHNTPIHAATSS